MGIWQNHNLEEKDEEDEASKHQEDYTVPTRWALSRQNLSSGFPTKRVSNQSLQLQRLARNLKCHLLQVYI